MGYESRDYFRDESYSRRHYSGGFMDNAPMCKRILIVTIVVYLIQIFITRPVTIEDVKNRLGQIPETQVEEIPEELLAEIAAQIKTISIADEWLELDTNKVIQQGQVWRLLTSAFCHGHPGIFHILINMLMLFWFGGAIENRYGSKEFLIFYLLAAVISSLVYIGVQLLTGERFPAIGASGAVMAVICVFTMLHPNHVVYLMLIVPIQMRFLLLLYVVYDLHPIILKLSGAEIRTGIAHAAHLGGLIFGFLYWKLNWRLSSIWDKVANRFGNGSRSQKVKSANFKIHRDPEDTGQTQTRHREPGFDKELDDVLARISRVGEENLTDHEREILARASKRYRKQ